MNRTLRLVAARVLWVTAYKIEWPMRLHERMIARLASMVGMVACKPFDPIAPRDPAARLARAMASIALRLREQA